MIIPMFAEGCFPYNYHTDDQEAMDDFLIKMRNLVYVSMTRAKYLLTITFWGKGGSRFIGEMDQSLYEWEGEPFKTTTKKSGASTVIQPQMSPVSPMATKSEPNPNIGTTQNTTGSLANFMRTKGLEVIDKRDKGGALWVVGDKGLDSILKESRSKFGALWTYSEKGGGATKHRSAWFTKSPK